MTTPSNLPPLPRIESLELRLRLDATITVNPRGGEATEWMKPGAEAATIWRGYDYNGEYVEAIPDEQQIKAAFEFLQTQIIAPALEDVIVAVQERLVEHRRMG